MAITFNSNDTSLYDVRDSYPKIIRSERLILRKDAVHDLLGVKYTILLKDSLIEIGTTSIFFDGEIWYMLYSEFRGNGYATEAVSKLMEISAVTFSYLSIAADNISSQRVANRLGFKITGKKSHRKNHLVFEKTK